MTHAENEPELTQGTADLAAAVTAERYGVANWRSPLTEHERAAGVRPLVEPWEQLPARPTMTTAEAVAIADTWTPEQHRTFAAFIAGWDPRAVAAFVSIGAGR